MQQDLQNFLLNAQKKIEKTLNQKIKNHGYNSEVEKLKILHELIKEQFNKGSNS